VLYFGLIIWVVKDLSSWPILATVILGGATIVLVCVLRIQYTLRKDAANLIGACYILIAEYLPKDDKDLQKVDLSVAILQKEKQRSSRCNYRPTGHHSYILPKVLLEMMEKTNEVGHEPRIRLDYISYSLVIAGAIIGGMIIWFR
jgi:hypothetical protein